MVGRPIHVPNEEQILERAKKIREEGVGWKTVANRLNAGVGQEWLKRRLVPGYAAYMNEQYQKHIKLVKHLHHRSTPHFDPLSNEELKRIKENLPEDNRDLTGKLLGDPIYERSALYKKQQGAGA